MRMLADMYLDRLNEVQVNRRPSPRGKTEHELYFQQGDVEFSVWFKTAGDMARLAKMLLVHAADFEEEQPNERRFNNDYHQQTQPPQSLCIPCE